MRSIRSLIVAASVVAAGSLGAQTPESGTGTTFHITPYAGYMFFGDYLKGPLGTSVTNAPGLMYGTQINMALSPNISLVGNLGYTSSDIQIGVPFFGGVGTGLRSTIYMYDAGLEYDFQAMKNGSVPFTPFVTAGVGAMRYNIDGDLLSTQATNLAGNVGLGADFVVGRGVALRLMAKDYIGQFNFQDAIGFSGLTGQTANNFALTAGLKFDF
jgi:outer membrane protein with beta-barrel domain